MAALPPTDHKLALSCLPVYFSAAVLHSSRLLTPNSGPEATRKYRLSKKSNSQQRKKDTLIGMYCIRVTKTQKDTH
jgi:hypothetical protein